MRPGDYEWWMSPGDDEWWTDDDLRQWFADFRPRCLPGFRVAEADGSIRLITNVEMCRYVQAAHVLRRDVRQAAEIADFLTGAQHGKKRTDKATRGTGGGN